MSRRPRRHHLSPGSALSERIHKVLAQAGVGSRREIERAISAGRVLINGIPARIGDRLEGGERVTLDGKRVRFQLNRQSRHEHLAYYKPVGEVSTRSDPEGRATVFDRLPRPASGRWVCVGRLDLNTSGLLILTTDGELAHRLMHPRYSIVRRYAVRVLGELSGEQLARLSEGVALDDGPARLEDVRLNRRQSPGKNSWLDVSIREGRKREVRRIFEAIGVPVSRLIRVGYGSVKLGRMRRGQYRQLTTPELTALYHSVGLEQTDSAMARKDSRRGRMRS